MPAVGWVGRWLPVFLVPVQVHSAKHQYGFCKVCSELREFHASMPIYVSGSLRRTELFGCRPTWRIMRVSPFVETLDSSSLISMSRRGVV